MDYRRLLHRAWNIIWQNKFLIFLGILVALGSSSGSSGISSGSQSLTQLEQTRDAGLILKNLMSGGLKVYGKEISRLVPKIAKDASKMPEIVLDQDTEIDALMENAELIASEFEATLEVLRAQDSKDPKAKQAMPGKSAILLE